MIKMNLINSIISRNITNIFRKHLKLLFDSKFIHAYRDHVKNKYVTYKEALVNIYRNRDVKYVTYRINSVKKFKTSDTIFILGSGPSINLLSEDKINHIYKHDSFGVNKSFLFNELVPTFHLHNWEAGRYRKYEKIFAPYRKNYEGVISLIHEKYCNRLIHPRITNTLFPKGFIRTCKFKIPEPIKIYGNRSKFYDNDFEESLSYRGTLSLGLHLAVNELEYDKIVLLGVDLDTNKHFYDDYEILKNNEYYGKNKRNRHYQELFGAKSEGYEFESMYPKAGNPIPMNDYYYSVADYIKRRNGSELFIGFTNNILYPKIPAYFN